MKNKRSKNLLILISTVILIIIGVFCIITICGCSSCTSTYSSISEEPEVNEDEEIEIETENEEEIEGGRNNIPHPSEDKSDEEEVHIHSMSYVPSETPSCTEDGNCEYWFCEDCEKYFLDADGTSETSFNNIVLTKIGHNFENYKSNNDASCTKDGTITAYCSNGCGESYTTILEESALGHNWSSAYTSDEDSHWLTCTRDSCSEIRSSDHTYEECKEQSKSATCTETGEIVYECSVCGYKKTEIISTTGHDLQHAERKEATCTEDGNIEYWYCSVCEKYFSDKDCESETTLASVTLPAKGHNYGEPTWSWADDYTLATAVFTCKEKDDTKEITATVTTSITDATCKENGVTSYIATVEFIDEKYSDSKTVDIPTTDHSYSEYVSDSNATCTKDGTKTSKCTVCGKTDTITDEGTATGHTYGEWEVTTEPTVLDKGLITKTCNNCGGEETCVLPELNETDYAYKVTKEATCTVNGSAIYTYTIDEQPIVIEVAVKANGHVSGTAVKENETEATCTTKGSYESVVYCSVCDAELSRETVTFEVMKHSYSEYGICQGCKGTIVSLELKVSDEGSYYIVTGWNDESETDIVIPSEYNDVSITTIDFEAFKGKSITSLTIYSVNISIGTSAFEECTSLTSITIYGTSISIGQRAFYKCISLTTLTLESINTIESLEIDSNAFATTSITKVTLPLSSNTIYAAYVFGGLNTGKIEAYSNLTEIIFIVIDGTLPEQLTVGAFYFATNNGDGVTFYVTFKYLKSSFTSDQKTSISSSLVPATTNYYSVGFYDSK